MSLRIQDTIFVPTETGEYQIQLCYGDITKLEEKMDIVMVSAFPGDYAPIAGTLIGALKRNLNLSVNLLAKHKEMDLRTHFSCWMSRKLPEELPYKRLLCFERSLTKGDKGDDITEQLRDMFRVFVPACGNQETTVITPLLGTGNQGYDEAMILSCMVEAAASWMQAGLPLKCIKLVIYQEGLTDYNQIFTSLKKKLMAKTEKKSDVVEITYDIFITYEESDKEWVNMVTNMLQSKSKELRIYTEIQKFDKHKIWQDNVFKIMACSKKIVAILTPYFVSSKECIDQFNMAMCCNRLKNSEVLFPFLVTSVESMPVYMKLVQYFDCRIRKEGDVLEVKINQACTFVINPSLSKPQNTDDEDPAERFQYDIFISYSHKHPEQAQTMIKMMTEANPDLKIFFDRSELTMGSMWQSSLYESLDGSECIVALLSPAYFSSVICQEEYNIALARHLAWPTGVLFIPVLVEPMKEIPSQFSRICMIDGTGDKFEKVAENLTQKINKWLWNEEKIPYLQQPVDNYSFHSIENARKEIVEEEYTLDTKLHSMNPVENIEDLKPSAEGNIDIAISFARDTIAYVGTLNLIFGMTNDQLQISYLNENAQGSLQDLDKAKQILIILSKEYLESTHHMQELHVALCRQRDAKTERIVRIIMDRNLPEKPMFVHLLPCETNLSDTIWNVYHKKSCSKGQKKTVMSYKIGMMGTFSIPYGIYFGLQKAAFDVMKSLLGSNKEKVVPPIICNMLEARLRDKGYPSSVQVAQFLIDIFSDNQQVKIEPLKQKKIKEVSSKEEGGNICNTENDTGQEKLQVRRSVIKWAEVEDAKGDNTNSQAEKSQTESVKNKNNKCIESNSCNLL